jgi:hypothetical protein
MVRWDLALDLFVAILVGLIPTLRQVVACLFGYVFAHT